MRIHRLALEGIGPFAARQEIDFDELSAGGLFLLTGPTGAGKTTMLDAIVYALYGTVPGARGEGIRGDKGTSDRIVSDLRDVNTQPLVELEITVAERRLRLVRVPQHLRPKSRGEGLTIEKGSVALSEFIGGEWAPRTSDPQEVGTEIKDLLGMSAAQFAQVVLLPQGEFAGFLRADDKSRREVLERLFQVDQYKGAQAWFDERSRAARARLEEAQGDLRGIVDRLAGALGPAAGPLPEDHHLDVLEGWVRERRFAADEIRELAAVDAETATTARTTATSRVRDAEQLLARIAERDARAAALRTLQGRLPGARTWIEANESAELAAREDQWAAAARDAEAHLARVEERRGDAERAAQLATEAAAATTTAAEAETGALAADAHVHELSAALREAQSAAAASAIADETVAALGRERDALAACLAAATRRDALLRDQHQAQAAAAQAQQSSEAARAAAEALPAPDQAEAQLTAALEVLARQEVALSERTATRDRARLEAQRAGEQLERASGLQGHLATAAAEHAARHEAWQQAREQHLQAREARLDAMAAELAAAMDDHTPCPVCGSTEHPAPAPPAPGGDLRAAERAAEERATAAQRAAERAATVLAEVRGQLDALGDLAALEAALRTHRASVESITQQLAADAAAITEQRATVEGARSLLTQARTAADATNAAEQSVGEARHRLEVLASSIEAATREAGPDRLTPDDLARAEAELHRVRQLQAQAAHARERVVAVERELDATRRRASELRERAASASAAARAASAQADAITTHLTALIAPHADLAEACAHAARRAQLLSEAARIVAACTTARAELTTAETAATQAAAQDAPTESEPDDPQQRLELRTAAATAAERHREETAAALRDADRHLAELQRAADALAQAREVLGPAAEEAERLQRLSDTVRGLGDNRRRISLTTYVLAARLEEVAAAATLHLQRMSGGRYALVHHDERFGNGPAGLGLRVLDAYSGEERETATLSGGEAFYASLSLALGLADVVQSEAGGRPLETLLVDEGFGALDADTLEEVLGELDELRAAGRAIGLVSHVPALAERIPAQLRVTAGSSGSTARVVVGELSV